MTHLTVSPISKATVELETPQLRTKIFLLPGLDATGKLLEELSICLSNKNLHPIIISYPNTQDAEVWQYEDYARYVAQKIEEHTVPAEKYTLMAESFSGPIVAHVYKKLKSNLTHLIFVASFVKNPIVGASILQKINLDKIQQWCALAQSDKDNTTSLTQLSPASLPRTASMSYSSNPKTTSLSSLPLKLVIAAGLGFKPTLAQRQKVKEVVCQLTPSMIMARIQLILNIDNKAVELQNFQSSSARILYVSGRFDTIILPHAFKTLKNAHPQAECVKISAPHFINHTFPKETANLISDFIGGKKVENLPWHSSDLLPLEA